MTADQIMDLVRQIERASERSVWYLKFTCEPTYPRFELRHYEDMAVSYTRMAGHYANLLIELAERGEGRAA